MNFRKLELAFNKTYKELKKNLEQEDITVITDSIKKYKPLPFLGDISYNFGKKINFTKGVVDIQKNLLKWLFVHPETNKPMKIIYQLYREYVNTFIIHMALKSYTFGNITRTKINSFSTFFKSLSLNDPSLELKSPITFYFLKGKEYIKYGKFEIETQYLYDIVWVSNRKCILVFISDDEEYVYPKTIVISFPRPRFRVKFWGDYSSFMHYYIFLISLIRKINLRDSDLFSYLLLFKKQIDSTFFKSLYTLNLIKDELYGEIKYLQHFLYKFGPKVEVLISTSCDVTIEDIANLRKIEFGDYIMGEEL